MSNPIAKARRSKAKDARQSPAPDTLTHKGKKKRAKKEWVVIGPWRNGRGEVMELHKAATFEQAEQWLEKMKRHCHWREDWSRWRIEKIT